MIDSIHGFRTWRVNAKIKIGEFKLTNNGREKFWRNFMKLNLCSWGWV